MPNKNFGISLTLEERNFLNNYSKLMIQYGSPEHFPISNDEKFAQYSRLTEILDKLTPEEIAEFNKLSEKASLKDFDEQFGDNFGSR